MAFLLEGSDCRPAFGEIREPDVTPRHEPGGAFGGLGASDTAFDGEQYGRWVPVIARTEATCFVTRAVANRALANRRFRPELDLQVEVQLRSNTHNAYQIRNSGTSESQTKPIRPSRSGHTRTTGHIACRAPCLSTPRDVSTYIARPPGPIPPRKTRRNSQPLKRPTILVQASVGNQQGIREPSAIG